MICPIHPNCTCEDECGDGVPHHMLRSLPLGASTAPDHRDETLQDTTVIVPECMLPNDGKSCDGYAALVAERDALKKALNDLIITATLLYQNAEGCAVNHHGLDFEQQGLPGWLRDAHAAIEAADAALSPSHQREEGK